MTTKASKHGLRAAAAERSKKHAQRTPLPPRPGQVEAAAELLEEWVNHNAETDRMEEEEAVGAPGADTRSPAKARAFADRAEAAGWTVAIGLVGGGATELTATRGAETMVQSWSGGVWQYDASFYGYGDRTTKPRNASGAAKLLERSPEDAAAEASKVAANKHFRKAEPKDLATRLEDARKSLPFSPDDADEIILGTLSGQALVWYNRLSRGTESAMVSRRGARMSVTPKGERVVTFCCPATGYRSCLVTAILKVGRGRVATTKGADVASVEVEG